MLRLALHQRGVTFFQAGEAFETHAELGLPALELDLRLTDAPFAGVELRQLGESRLELCLLAGQLCLGLRDSALLLRESGRLRSQLGSRLGEGTLCLLELLHLHIDVSLPLRPAP